MNPFNSYSGFRLNGKYYGVTDILNPERDTSELNENQIQALAFAAELFSNSEAIRVQTSGSTGTPKSLQFSKRAVIISAQATNRFFNLNEKSTAVLPLPIRYIAGKMMVARAIVGKYNLIVLDPVSNPNLDNLKSDFMPVTPFQMHNLIAKQPEYLKNIKTYLIGGGEPNKSLIAKINEHNISAFASFGMTETLSHFALTNLKGVSDRPDYIPLKGVEIEIDDDGSLLINWPSLTSGQLNTNDIVERTATGFKWLGRGDNLINSGGVKIIPERVESILQDFIQVPFFVSEIPHPTLGQELVIFAEAEISLDLNAIRWDFKHQQPRKIVVISSFSRTVSDKIKRRETVENWLRTSA